MFPSITNQPIFLVEAEGEPEDLINLDLGKIIFEDIFPDIPKGSFYCALVNLSELALPISTEQVIKSFEDVREYCGL